MYPEQLLYFGSDNIKLLASSSLQMAGRFTQIEGTMTFRQIHIEKKKKKTYSKYLPRT